MKTQEELNELREEVETLNRKLDELTDEELSQVAGGDDHGRTTLDKYLKSICPDKNRILVDHGEGKKLSLDNSVKLDDKNNVYVLPRH